MTEIRRALETEDGYRRLLAAVGAEEHPALPMPSRLRLIAEWEAAGQESGASVGAPSRDAAVIGLLNRRRRAIELQREDPFNYGDVLECWKTADELLQETNFLVVFGGNRASKTEYGCYKGLKLLARVPRSRVLFLHECETSSVEVQQKCTWRWFPNEWRRIKRGQIANIKYDEKNGFSNNKFVTPIGSVGMYGNYNQNVRDYEGLEYDLVVADENLPLRWLTTLLARVATRNGKIIWLYTPLDGITPAIKEVVTGAATIATRPVDPEVMEPNQRHVDGCPPGTMPYVQRGLYANCRIIYFHSDLNPYGGYDTLKRLYSNHDKPTKERRLYGYARNQVRMQFPMFGSVNVIAAARVPKEVTRYHIVDPAGTRNMFMMWIAVDRRGYHYVYREWPDQEQHGEWAMPSEDSKRWDGVPGPAQGTLGYGVSDYKRLILGLEGAQEGGGGNGSRGRSPSQEVLERRYMDPRSGKQETVAENSGGMSLMDRFRELQLDREGRVVGPYMDFLPAPGLDEGEGIQQINDLLSYDRNVPLTAHVNEPKLYVVDSCHNTIWALSNYTAHDGKDAACKDPIDCLRYAVTAKLEYVAPGQEQSWGGGSY